ncbi:MAG: ABC transporter permease [Ilumatobacteraceae bacterium]
MINIDIYSIVSAAILVGGLSALLRFTGLGRSIKATCSNPEMALIVGVDPARIYLVVFAIASLFAGVAAVWAAIKYSVEPTMGFRPVVLAFVVAFLGGTAKPQSGLRDRHRDRSHRDHQFDLAPSAVDPTRGLRDPGPLSDLVLRQPIRVHTTRRSDHRKGVEPCRVAANYIDQILIFSIFALSLNLLLGYMGQVSVAHASFGAIGGYSVGYLSITHGWNVFIAALFGAALAGIVGAVVALPALRLSVEYLILLTLGVSSVLLGLFTTFSQLGGTYGLIGIPKRVDLRAPAHQDQRLVAPARRDPRHRVLDLPPTR